MNFSFQWMLTAIDGIADFARSALPWQYRSSASNWAVFAVIFGISACIFGLLYFWFREKPKIDWNFERTGYPVFLSGSVDKEGIATFHVDGLQFGGENISGHALHQIDGGITLSRTKKDLPLFVIIDGAWAPLSELESVPPRAILLVGFSFRSDGVHLPEFPLRMSPDQFLRDFGAFTLDVTIDGDKKTWSFTVDDLREQFEKQKRDREEELLKDPMRRPQLKKKQPA
jgi:hypothetical protein